jgi:putative serine protease PepD
MTEDSSGSEASGARGRSVVWMLVGLLLAAVVGGIAGGLIVRATWGSRGGNSAADVCPAARVATRALPSVVTVQAANGQAAETGSGVVIRPDGYILTNDHVISPAANGGTISILRADEGTTDATIVGRDPLTDLAVIRAKDGSDLPVIALAKSEALNVGQPVVALGSPLGLASTVTAGIVSALNRSVRVPSGSGQAAHLVGAIQTDASINPGNSGGALVDCDARLVGINTAGAAVGSTPGSIGLGFAIPIDLAEGIADELIADGKVTRPSLGMQVQPVSRELAQATGGTAGLFVQAVNAGGPADKAGLRPGDVIVEVDGEQAQSVDPLVVSTLKMKAGDVLNLKFERQGASHPAALTLAAG